MATDFLIHRPKPLPHWEMPIQAEHIARIRTLKEEELELTGKILDTWTRIYFLFPAQLTCGPLLSSGCRRSFYRGKVVVGEDAKGVAQVFARVTTNSDGLFVEELVTAPWNNSLCKKHLETVGAEAFWSARPARKELVILASGHGVSREELTTARKGSGAIMMFALCYFAKHYGARSIGLNSNPEGMEFYRKIGMRQVLREYAIFVFDLSDDVPEVLEKKVSEYFLKHAA